METRSVRTTGIVVLLALLANLGVFANGFTIDDDEIILRGSLIHDPGRLPQVLTHRAMIVRSDASTTNSTIDTYRPVALVTFFSDAALSGRRPWAYHLTNLIAHVTVVILVLLLARRLLPVDRADWAAFAAGWVAVQPVAAEAHVWVNGRSDVLAALFTLLSLWIGGIGDRKLSSVLRGSLTALTFLLACLAKETALLAAGCVLVWQAGVLTRPRAEWRANVGPALRSVWPWMVAALVYLALRRAVLSGMRVGTSGEVLSGLARLPLFWLEGLRQMILPSTVSMRTFALDAGGTRWQVAGWITVALIGIGVFRARTRIPNLALGLAWFAAMSAPATIVVWPGFGRYFYLPLTLLAIGAADSLATLQEQTSRPHLVRAGAGLYLTLSALLLQVTILTYRNDEHFYTAMLADSPSSSRGWGGLGRVRAEQRRYAEAIPLLERAIEMKRDWIDAKNLGLAYVMSGRHADAYRFAIAALRMNPEHPEDYFNIAALAAMNHDPELATRMLLEGMLVAPNDRPLQQNLARLRTRHPARARFENLLQQSLDQPRYARLRPRLDAPPDPRGQP